MNLNPLQNGAAMQVREPVIRAGSGDTRTVKVAVRRDDRENVADLSFTVPTGANAFWHINRKVSSYLILTERWHQFMLIVGQSVYGGQSASGIIA